MPASFSAEKARHTAEYQLACTLVTIGELVVPSHAPGSPYAPATAAIPTSLSTVLCRTAVLWLLSQPSQACASSLTLALSDSWNRGYASTPNVGSGRLESWFSNESKFS